MREDITDLVLNVKEIALKMNSEGPKRLTLAKQGPGSVTAGDIKVTGDIEVLNPDLVLCHLDDGAEINIEFTVNTGRDVPAAATSGVAPIGTCGRALSPRYQGGDKEGRPRGPGLDTTSDDAGRDQRRSADDEVLDARRLQDSSRCRQLRGTSRKAQARSRAPLPGDFQEGRRAELSVRSANCSDDNIVSRRPHTEDRARLRTPNFGRKSLNEIKEVLAQMGLHLGMDVANWPPENIDDLAKRYEDHY